MISQPHEYQMKDESGGLIDSIDHLIRWIAPRTVGRNRVLERLADVKKARQEIHRLHDALCLLSRELDALYPKGAVIRLAKRRVRDAVLTLAQT